MTPPNYTQVQSEMKTGDCLLWQSDSTLGWLIRKFTKSDVNHASLIVRPPDYEGLRDRRFQLEALEQGIILRLVSQRVSNHKGKIFWYPLKDEYAEAQDIIGSWAFLQVGTGYDFGSLFRQAVCRVSADAKKFFCSEFCFMAWQAGGLPVSGKAPRPGDIPGLGIIKDSFRIL